MPLKRTPLYDTHAAAGAKLVDFGGWEMPLNYGSQIEEHHAVRRDAGMFDVSHMRPVDLEGADSRRFLLTLIANMLNDLNLSDMETCYKVFTREVRDSIKVQSDRFGFEPEFTAKVAKKNYRIFEVPISYAGRGYKEGKKITWRDGLAALYWIFRYRFFD